MKFNSTVPLFAETGATLTIHSEDRPRSSARIRGAVAMRIIGELITRLAAGDNWDFAAFGRDDQLILSGSSSSGAAPDLPALRAELRLQRFAGSVLPHVSTPLASEQRRALFVIFGEFNDRVAVLRVMRPAAHKAFVPRDGVAIEQFFRRHAEAMAGAIFDVNVDDAEGVVTRRATPIAFTIDNAGTVIASSDEPEADASSLRAQLMPLNGEVPVVLRGVIAELLERRRQGVRGDDLVIVLPFALVRLTPLRSRTAVPTSLVTVEWLRSRASLEATAAQYSISKRELQVLASMLRGAAVAQIAAELSISESTVVFHLKRMLKKTLSKNRTELAARMLGWDIPAVS